MDVHRSSNIDKSQDFFGGGQSFRPPIDSKPSIKLQEADKQPESVSNSIQSVQKELSENSGNDAQKALQGLLKRADNLTAQQVESHIQKLATQQKDINSVKISILTTERDATLNDLADPVTRREAATLASLLERAKDEPNSAFMDCLVAKLSADLKMLAPSFAKKQEQIDKLTTSDEIELLKGFKDLPFKSRLALVLSTQNAEESAQLLTELSAQFSDWEINRHFSRLSLEQAKQFDEKLNQSRNSIFENYWAIWNPEVQARAQQIELELRELIDDLPPAKQAEAHQLISDLCQPKKQHDPVVGKFLLNHISPQLAEKAQRLADLRAPLLVVERQDKFLARLKRHFDIFGPLATADTVD